MRIYKKDGIVWLDVVKDEFFYIKSTTTELKSNILEVFEEDQVYNLVDYIDNIIYSGIKDFTLYDNWYISLSTPTIKVEDGEITYMEVEEDE